ncbi:MAG: methyltransferase [Acetobacter papayae]|uniref:tRNA1(Val) (adenine(37)-N6)-methyltransferase n=1 Tax=Acetobacter papayae TaxID=1076592 RepID=UPI0039EA182C
MPPALPSPAAPSAPPTTQGFLLRGRVSYTQFAQGYRTGLEPVLMAAAVNARAGQNVLEIGCGAGAGLLCLMHRVPGLAATGMEKDPQTAELARQNLQANSYPHATILTGSFPEDWHLEEGVEAPRFDHCMANPPWHADNGAPSPEPRRDLARRLGQHTLRRWIEGCATVLRHKGSITLALPTSLADQALVALSASGFGGSTLYPFWPKSGREARIMLVQARLGVKSPARLLPGLVLHEADGAFTTAARTILEDAAPLGIG